MASHTRIRSFARRLTTVTSAVLLLGAAPALASCPSPSASTPFAQWGDTNSYFIVPGASFEGTPDDVGWNLWNAGLTPGNEPFDVGSPTDDQSLTIDAGGVATSPTFCLDDTMSDIRFIAQEDEAGSDLQVNLLVWRWHRMYTIPIADLSDGSMPSWAPTAPLSLPTGNIPNGYSVTAALQVVVPSSQGSWQIDDMYVDPYRSG